VYETATKLKDNLGVAVGGLQDQVVNLQETLVSQDRYIRRLNRLYFDNMNKLVGQSKLLVQHSFAMFEHFLVQHNTSKSKILTETSNNDMLCFNVDNKQNTILNSIQSSAAVSQEENDNFIMDKERNSISNDTNDNSKLITTPNSHLKTVTPFVSNAKLHKKSYPIPIASYLHPSWLILQITTLLLITSCPPSKTTMFLMSWTQMV
jgi:hypothetical protein